MRTKKKYLAVLFIICMLAGCISAPESTVQKEVTNLILNGGFEEGEDNPSHWLIEASPSSGLKMYRDNKISHSGEASISIVNRDEPNNAVNAWKQTITEFPIDKRLILSGFIKIEDLSPVAKTGIRVQMKDVNGTVTREASIQYTHSLVDTQGWIEIHGDIFVPSETKEIQITVFLQEKGQVWFDDVQLSEASLESKEWTLMFYDDADFYGPNYKSAFAEEAYATENLNILILEDTETGPASTWSVQETGNAVKVKDNGEVNMGSYETLRDFITFCKKWYPAERYMLLLYDHGAGWKGACVDITSGGDVLTPDEMKRAITETGEIDIIGFSAPCLMGAIEPAYELRNCVDVYIGSEEISGYKYWRYVIRSICEILDNNADHSNIVIGDAVIELIRERNYFEVTMSAIRTDRIEALADAIDIFTGDLIHIPHEDIVNVYSVTQSFGYGLVVDIYDFADKCAHSLPETCKHAQEVTKKLKEVVINECHDENHPGAHGLTIYFPDIHSEYFEYIWDPSYSTSDLDFTEDTQWDEFLSLYYDSE